MKIRFLLPIFLLTLIVALTSCASKEKPPRERDETFIANINPFDVETYHLYATVNIGKPKVSDFYVTFAPRTNYLFIKARLGIDVVRVGFSYEDRMMISEAANQYLEAYENGNIPNVKPTKKNAYSKGTVLFEWGATGLAHEVIPTYRTNAQYLEPNKPYFLISIDSMEEEGRDHISSPRIGIYISPSQWETIIEKCNQQNLEAMTDEILAEAEAF